VEETRVPGEKHWPAASHFILCQSTKFKSTINCVHDSLLPIHKEKLYLGPSWSWSYGIPITTNVVSLNPAHGEVYSIHHYVIKFVSDLWQVRDFLRVLWFPPPQYNWNIVGPITTTILYKYRNSFNQIKISCTKCTRSH
jgi:hypothetical protein